MPLGSYYLKKDATQRPEWVKMLVAAHKELLASPIRKDYEGDDDDFFDEIWQAFEDDDLFPESPSLQKALLEWVRDSAESTISGWSYRYQSAELARKHLMDNVEGRNGAVVVCHLDDWYTESSEILLELSKQKRQKTDAGKT